MSTAQTTSAPAAPLADRVTDQALAEVDTLLQGDQKMAGAEGPAQSYPEAFESLAVAASNVQSRVGDAVAWGTGQALDILAAAKGVSPFLRALLRPLVQNALRLFASALHDVVIVPLEKELASIAASHPNVSLDRAQIIVGKFYDADPSLPRPAPAQPSGPSVSPSMGQYAPGQDIGLESAQPPKIDTTPPVAQPSEAPSSG